jgi:hypothetical protein
MNNRLIPASVNVAIRTSVLHPNLSMPRQCCCRKLTGCGLM